MQWPPRKGIERVYRRSEKASQMLWPVMVQSLFSLRLEVVMQNLNITPNLGFVQCVAFSLRSWLIWNQKAGRKIQAMSQQYPLALPISLIPACSGGKELALSADERWKLDAKWWAMRPSGEAEEILMPWGECSAFFLRADTYFFKHAISLLFTLSNAHMCN